MKQSRLMSLVETMTNVVVGFIISLIAQLYIFNAYGVHLAFHDNLMITLFFTGVSIARSYILRRCFEHVRVRGVRA